MKYLILGLGAVGFSFLKKLKENGLFKADDFYCVDKSEKTKEDFIKIGGKSYNFSLDKVTKDNYLKYLNTLDENDYLLDFCIDIKNLEILEYCLIHNIHYLSTADSSWNPDPTWMSDHQHFLEYLKLKEKYAKKQNTCLVLFGMNPGLVSLFAKKCLKEIIISDKGKYIKCNRNKLLKLLDEGKYGLASKKIGVTDIQEIDNDTQITDIPYDESVCYSTRNCWAYYYETVSSPEIAFGNKKRFYKCKKIYDYDPSDLYLSLYKSGYEYPITTFSPQGNVLGHISTHEEIFTIRKYFSYKKYKPTVHFVYSPCEYAIKSIKRFKYYSPTNLHLINKREIIDGGESVGIIFQGRKFNTRYFGNYLKTNEISDETATIRQVSASSYAGFIYILKHDKEGLLFPEELNEEEVLNTAKQYLNEYINIEIPKINIDLEM